MNNNIQKLTREQVEQLIPDYVLGRCSGEEKTLFEESIVGYPELQSEVSEAMSVFSALETMDVNSIIDQRVKNLSVNVNTELQKSKTPFLMRKGFGRFALPLVGAVSALILTVNSNYLQNVIHSTFGGNTSENSEVFTTQDEQKMASILTSSSDESSLSSITESMPIEHASATLDERSAVSITGMLDSELSELFTQPEDTDSQFNEATIEQRLTYEADQLETMIMEIEDAS